MPCANIPTPGPYTSGTCFPAQPADTVCHCPRHSGVDYEERFLEFLDR